MPVMSVVDPNNPPGPMQYPAVTLVDPSGGPYNPATSIPAGTYADDSAALHKGVAETLTRGKTYTPSGSSTEPAWSFAPPLPFAKTFTGPDRVMEFLGGTGAATTMPYLLSSYLTEKGAIYNGAGIVSSNKRLDVNGQILACSYNGTATDPSMFAASPDVNGPSYGAESHGGAWFITNKALTSNVATITTSTTHNFLVGQSVVVANVGSPFDGTFTLTAVTGTTFSYAVTNANVASAAVSGIAILSGFANQCAFKSYNLDEILGGATAYSIGYGTPRMVIDGQGRIWWGANLSNTPYASAYLSLGMQSSGKAALTGSSGTDPAFFVNGGVGRTFTLGTQVNGSNAWTVNGNSLTSVYIRLGTTTVCRMYDVTASGRMAIGGADDTAGILSVLSNNDAVPVLRLKANSTSQSADLLQVLDSTAAILSRFGKGGRFGTRVNSAPADADVATSEAMLWFDNTNGAGKLMVKAKTANGTVVTGSVTLT